VPVSDQQTIPIPWSVRTNRFLTQHLQWLLFCGSAAALIAIWWGRQPQIVVPGRVEMVTVVVPATDSGLLETGDREPARLDRVQKGVQESRCAA